MKSNSIWYTIYHNANSPTVSFATLQDENALLKARLEVFEQQGANIEGNKRSGRESTIAALLLDIHNAAQGDDESETSYLISPLPTMKGSRSHTDSTINDATTTYVISPLPKTSHTKSMSHVRSSSKSNISSAEKAATV